MKLQYFRKNAKLTQLEVANKLGIKKQTYSGYETGSHKPTPEALVKLADIFDVTLDELLERVPIQKIFDDARMPKTEVQELYDRLTPHQQKLSIAYMQCFDDGNRENEQQKTAQLREQTQYKW